MSRNLVHGRKGRVWLDDLAGTLQEISGAVDKFQIKSDADRPETQGSGHTGKRYATRGKLKADITMSGKIGIATGLARIHGRRGRWLWDGVNLSRSVKSGTIDTSCELPPTSGAEDFERYETTGFTDGAVSISGHADYGVGEVADVVRNGLEIDPADGPLPLAALGIRGFAPGLPVEFWAAAVTSVPEGHDNSQPNAFSAESKAHDGVWLGLSLADLVPVTAAAPVNGTAVDDASSTTAGGRVRLHVTDLQGTTPTATFKFQTSADASTWVDAATFVAMTAIGAQEIQIAAGVTLNRHLRVVLSAGTYDSVTFTAFIHRTGATNAVAGGYRHLRGLLQLDDASSFKHHPDGTGAGRREFTGECHLATLKLAFDSEQVMTWDATLMVDGGVTRTKQA